MKEDPHLVYSLEIRILDLEKKLEALERQLSTVTDTRSAGRKSAADTLPKDLSDKLKTGENKVKLIRTYRALTQKELSDRCGIRANHISAIERGMPYGLKTARRLAEALNVPVDLLL